MIWGKWSGYSYPFTLLSVGSVVLSKWLLTPEGSTRLPPGLILCQEGAVPRMNRLEVMGGTPLTWVQETCLCGLTCGHI